MTPIEKSLSICATSGLTVSFICSVILALFFRHDILSSSDHQSITFARVSFYMIAGPFIVTIIGYVAFRIAYYFTRKMRQRYIQLLKDSIANKQA